MEAQSALEAERKQKVELEDKHQQGQALLLQLESQMSASGESQNEYIAQLKTAQVTMEEKFKQ